MVRTQIQLPEDLYGRLRELARAREWSIAEAIRRATELLVSVYPQVRQTPSKEWELPLVDLGEPLVPLEKWPEILEKEMIERHLK